VKLSIDGRDIEARDGETLLDCALRNGIEIPHLCANEGLAPYGGCRMCVVEIEGMRGYPPSCTTPAAEGMVVRTQGPELKKLRRNVLGLMMLEHPNACLLCGRRAECEAYRPEPEKAGRTTGCHTCNNKPVCEVRGLAEELELAELPVPPIYHQRPLERDNPFMDRDLNLCILCGRCVRVCKEQQGRAVIDFVGRGSNARIGQAFGMRLLAHRRDMSGTPPEGVEYAPLDQLFAESDAVSLHCPLTPETQGLVNAERLARMKPTAFLINTSRGPLIVEEDLAEALHGHRLAGAAVDVLSTEPPPPDNPLLTAPNCLITPHLAWASAAARRRLIDIAAGNLRAWIEGRPVNRVPLN